MFLFILPLVVLICNAQVVDSHPGSGYQPPPGTIVVDLVSGGGSGVSGRLTLVPGQGYVKISGKIFGLTPGKHGFHVHTNGDTADDCQAAGPHFNPDRHSSPRSPSRHAGDLGNILTPHGADVTSVYIVDTLIPLGDGGIRDVAGRAIVVHTDEDDLGRGIGDEKEESRITGNAGARVACGIIPDNGEADDYYYYY